MLQSNRCVHFAVMGCLALSSALFAGCGGSDGLPRESVSGVVMLDGQPLPSGSIQMLPVDSKVGVAGGAVIKDGKFEIGREQGLIPGQYRVVINSGQEATPPPSGEPPGPIAAADAAKEIIPAQYNAQTTLTADVKAGTPNTFPFDLKSK